MKNGRYYWNSLGGFYTLMSETNNSVMGGLALIFCLLSLLIVCAHISALLSLRQCGPPYSQQRPVYGEYKTRGPSKDRVKCHAKGNWLGLSPEQIFLFFSFLFSSDGGGGGEKTKRFRWPRSARLLLGGSDKNRHQQYVETCYVNEWDSTNLALPTAWPVPGIFSIWRRQRGGKNKNSIETEMEWWSTRRINQRQQ